jgi:hypothetical protein
MPDVYANITAADTATEHRLASVILVPICQRSEEDRKFIERISEIIFKQVLPAFHEMGLPGTQYDIEFCNLQRRIYSFCD